MSNFGTQIEHIEVEPGVHLAVQGPTSSDKPVVMLSNSVGTAMGMWDEVVNTCPANYASSVTTHGARSLDVPSGAWTIAHLGRDAIADS
jgi:3-oxoadipate enol-lactonase